MSLPKRWQAARPDSTSNIPTYYRKLGCTIPNQPLGNDYVIACGTDGKGGRAFALNALFDEWDHQRRTGTAPTEKRYKFGCVDWLFEEFKKSEAYKSRVSARVRPDYDATLLLLSDLVTKKGDRVGERPVRAISPRSADKLYAMICETGRGGTRLRQGEKLVAICRRAWRVVHRLYPDQFDRAVPNPWNGVTMRRRVKAQKPAVTRDQLYEFAQGAIKRGHPAAAAAAVPEHWPRLESDTRIGYRTAREHLFRMSPNPAIQNARKPRSRELHNPLKTRK